MVKTYLSGFKNLEQKIDIKFEKANMNLFIPRTNLQRAYKISRKATQEEFDEFHILNKKNSSLKIGCFYNGIDKYTVQNIKKQKR